MSVGECAHRPGLCDECDARSVRLQRWLADRPSSEFDADYFSNAEIDNPLWNPRRSCEVCGVIGGCYSWNEWRVGDEIIGTDVPAEGDGYRVCTNCETLTIIPWAGTERMLSLSSIYGAPSAATWYGGNMGHDGTVSLSVGSRSVLLVELLLLFTAAFIVAAAIL